MMLLAAAVATTALPFDPPTDRPLRYEVIERRPATGGGTRTATLEQEVRFAPAPDGYVLTVRGTGYRDDGPRAGAERLGEMMRTLNAVPLKVAVSAQGVPLHVIDAAASWGAMIDGLRTLAAGRPATDPLARRIAALLAQLSAASPAQRDAQLMASADTVVAAHLPPLAIGASAPDRGGAVTRLDDRDGDSRFRATRISPAPGGAAPVSIVEEVAVSHRTGLVDRSTVRLTQAGAPVSETEIRALPGN